MLLVQHFSSHSFVFFCVVGIFAPEEGCNVIIHEGPIDN